MAFKLEIYSVKKEGGFSVPIKKLVLAVLRIKNQKITNKTLFSTLLA
jgi:hypothetical protein